ncbi:serine/threonine-protein phosphatase 2A regulatory subunit B'' subunit gamma-like [Histomonas meleagridis]|uniref:serine/threonine-protein phosphatase 2A regulatory subunit B'' subunit gamma-like n=1 Tax=Histomonas meleagridis TaxID=135588 RepID=UPI00355A3A89|nr:serine/threonine-protein phosphatase 2A regulatory subunit B'' subunit gamma-like [Histomonas meleagridis]KAH0798214.1 serine/threonine-protein phosphatase 2A regulatory subunit B'' subunit gamma-like [Histomonas meleagridis]
MIPYASSGEYLMTIDDISDYLESKFSSFKTLSSLSTENLLPFYRQCVLEQISFHFDPFNTNKYSPFQLFSSPKFTQFFFIDENNTFKNPYSFTYFRHYYTEFINHISSEGMLSKRTFKHWGSYSFVDPFIDRFFECSTTFNECIDFAGFIRFVVFLDHPKHVNTSRYFFELFDVNGDGMLDMCDVDYFVKGLVRESKVFVPVDEVFREILDKACANDVFVTRDQFIECGCAYEIASILFDYKEFGLYYGKKDDD